MATADFLTSLLGVLAKAASAPSPRVSLEDASEAFRHLVPFDGAGLMLPRESIRSFYGRGYELWTAGTRSEPEPIPESAAIARPDAAGDVLIASRDELECEVSRSVLIARGHASVLAARLRVAEDREVGILLLFSDDPEAFRGVDPGPLLAGASIVAVAIEHARDRAALERLADELGQLSRELAHATGVLTRDVVAPLGRHRQPLEHLEP